MRITAASKKEQIRVACPFEARFVNRKNSTTKQLVVLTIHQRGSSSGHLWCRVVDVDGPDSQQYVGNILQLRRYEWINATPFLVCFYPITFCHALPPLHLPCIYLPQQSTPRSTRGQHAQRSGKEGKTTNQWPRAAVPAVHSTSRPQHQRATPQSAMYHPQLCHPLHEPHLPAHLTGP